MKPQNAFLFTVLLGLAAACAGKKAAETAAPETLTAVSTAPVTRQPLVAPVVGSGVLASKKEAKLSFKTGGIVAALRADEGQDVRKGQVLAVLNLTEIDAQVAQARNNFEKAQRDRDRVQRLYADSAATLEQMQNATTGYEVASAAFTAARFNRQHSVIVAPENGRILRRQVEEGELINPGSSVFLFAGGGAGEGWVVRTGIADRDMVKLKIGDRAKMTFDAYPGVSFPAVVTEIAGAADPVNGTFEVELKVDAQDKKLGSGLVAKAEIFPSGGAEMLVVPIEALAEADGERAFVYTLGEDGTTVKKLPIRTAGIYGDVVAVREGLREGTAVITRGTAYLTETSKVKVVNDKFQVVSTK
ncbi:MAG: efflux RND transporter periplasmic adaptor subunit [Cytophagales bacterium]|nr:efflux RND transporter periplasmic adaptor subunit [Cytophagales bacterium]